MTEPTLEERVSEIEEHGSIPAQHIRRRQLYAYALVVVVFILGVYSNHQHASDIADQQNQLQQGLIHSCEVNTNPLRTAVRKELQTQIAQSRSFDYTKLFPDIPRVKVHRLIAAQRRRQRIELQAIPPVHCRALNR
jgi:hypothetical protein